VIRRQIDEHRTELHLLLLLRGGLESSLVLLLRHTDSTRLLFAPCGCEAALVSRRSLFAFGLCCCCFGGGGTSCCCRLVSGLRGRLFRLESSRLLLLLLLQIRSLDRSNRIGCIRRKLFSTSTSTCTNCSGSLLVWLFFSFFGDMVSNVHLFGRSRISFHLHATWYMS
jgi:hypothetical protein